MISALILLFLYVMGLLVFSMVGGLSHDGLCTRVGYEPRFRSGVKVRAPSRDILGISLLFHSQASCRTVPQMVSNVVGCIHKLLSWYNGKYGIRCPFERWQVLAKLSPF